MPPTATATANPAPGKFIKLPGRTQVFRLRGQGFINLYLADHYLLQIEVITWREVYLKFAYKDIQAFEICRTSRGAICNWVLGTIAVLIAVAALLAKDSIEALITLGAIAGFFAALLLINTVQGATCKTVVQTATGRQTLRSLARLKTARRVLAKINERIEAVQGVLDQNTAAQQMEDFLLRRAVQQRQRQRAQPASAAEPASVAGPSPY